MRFNKIATAALAAALSLSVASVFADEATVHKEAALKHIKEGIASGKSSDKAAFLEHAKAAREETRAAMNQKTTAAIEKSSILVRNAIDAANEDHLDAATQKLEEAEKTLTAPVEHYKDSQG